MYKFAYFRYVLAAVAFYCMIVVNLTRSGFNVTILKMVGNCTNSSGNFCWNTETEELLVSSYFIGYTAQLLGGIMVSKIGAYYSCGLPLLLTIVLTFLTPLAAADWRALFLLRVGQGVGAAPSLPAITALWAQWAPRNERSTLFSMTLTGHFVGAALANILSGYLCDESEILGGSWPSVFLLYGILGIVWFVLWMTLASSDPKSNVWTSLDEKDYIELHTTPIRRRSPTPWVWLLKSPKCWAIYTVHCCSYFGYVTMLVGYPQFFREVHNLKLSETGYLSSIPILAMFVSSIVAGKMTDCLIERKVWSVTAARKINTAIGMFIPAGINLLIAFQKDFSLNCVIGLMALQNAANGFVLSGFQVNYIDICPEHAGVLMGFGNSLASLSGLAVPLLLYRFNSKSNNVRLEWGCMFVSVGIVMGVGGLVYTALGTGERQVDGASGYEVIPGTDSTAEGTTNVHSASKETSSGDSETDLNDSVLQEQELIAN